jgi:hypothetical protein
MLATVNDIAKNHEAAEKLFVYERIRATIPIIRPRQSMVIFLRISFG